MARLLMMKELRVVFMLAIVGAIWIASGSIASAQARTETHHLNVDECATYTSLKVCTEVSGILHYTSQPDRDVILVINADYCQTVWYEDELFYTRCERVSQGLVTLDSSVHEPHVSYMVRKGEHTNSETTCSWMTVLVFANGAWRVEHTDMECEPVA